MKLIVKRIDTNPVTLRNMIDCSESNTDFTSYPNLKAVITKDVPIFEDIKKINLFSVQAMLVGINYEKLYLVNPIINELLAYSAIEPIDFDITKHKIRIKHICLSIQAWEAICKSLNQQGVK